MKINELIPLVKGSMASNMGVEKERWEVLNKIARVAFYNKLSIGDSMKLIDQRLELNNTNEIMGVIYLLGVYMGESKTVKTVDESVDPKRVLKTYQTSEHLKAKADSNELGIEWSGPEIQIVKDPQTNKDSGGIVGLVKDVLERLAGKGGGDSNMQNNKNPYKKKDFDIPN